jgi:hypothetical protein
MVGVVALRGMGVMMLSGITRVFAGEGARVGGGVGRAIVAVLGIAPGPGAVDPPQPASSSTATMRAAQLLAQPSAAPGLLGRVKNTPLFLAELRQGPIACSFL